MSNQLKSVCLCNQLPQIPLIEEEKLIPLTQKSLLIELNFIRSCDNSKMIDANGLIFVAEPKHLFSLLHHIK